MKAEPFHRLRRRRLYFVEIHLGGSRVVEGVQRFRGMLDAESQVEQRATELSAVTGQALRGYMIQQIDRKDIKRMAALYGPLKTTDVSPLA